MKRPTNDPQARAFLLSIGLQVDEAVVRQVVQAIREGNPPLHRLYATTTTKDGRRSMPICGKGTAYKIKRLYEQSKLGPYLAYMDSSIWAEPELESHWGMNYWRDQKSIVESWTIERISMEQDRISRYHAQRLALGVGPLELETVPAPRLTSKQVETLYMHWPTLTRAHNEWCDKFEQLWNQVNMKVTPDDVPDWGRELIDRCAFDRCRAEALDAFDESKCKLLELLSELVNTTYPETLCPLCEDNIKDENLRNKLTSFDVKPLRPFSETLKMILDDPVLFGQYKTRTYER